MTFIDLTNADASERQGAAQVLLEAFTALGNPTWTTSEAAEAEVTDCVRKERIARAVLSADGRVIAWGGLRSMYGNRTWELHPLVVSPDWQSTGVGSALLTDLEDAARAYDIAAIVLGSDDETRSTTLSTVDFGTTSPLDALSAIAQIPGRPIHPFRFYQRRGYQIVGIIPDASGPGRPDIWMWKKL
ncbi:MAG: GNAT family N-acetyltransferase [Spirochaeta sp.]|jgi:aminoglycoside 6'-N-acetyltransferase I|nr:GNAT family N-acetyltransferase [Spirochaeta sp.]